MQSFFTTDTAELRQYVPSVVRNFTMSALVPVLNDVASTLLPRFLGATLAQSLSERDPTDSALDPVIKLAYGRAKSAVARLGFADYLPFAEVQIDDAGVSVTASQERRAAFEYQTKKLDSSLREMGWQDLDELIRIVAAHPDQFPEWEQAPYYLEHQQAIFKSAPEFSHYYPIQDRWLTFWALRPFIQAVEENLGEAALARIDALPDTVTDDQKEKPRRNLLRALAYQAVIAGLSGLAIDINGANVQVNYAGQYANSSYYTPPSRELLDWMRDNLQKQADLFYQNFEDGLLAITPVDPATPPEESAGPIDSTDLSIIWL